MNRIKKAAKDIREMKVQGAIKIALTAAIAMEFFIKDSKAKTRKEFIKELEQAGKILKATRPSAVALPNAIDTFIGQIKRSKANMPELKKVALKIGKKIIERNENAVKQIGRIGAKLVKSNQTVLIHCHSHTLMEVLKEAWRSGKRFKVICTETRPWQQGFISARELSAFGIPVTLIVDSAVMSFMPHVDMVFVGADTITKDGKVVNKIGTSQIALIAKHFKKPFYVIAQTLKFDKTGKGVKIEERPAKEILGNKRLSKVKIRNPVFDITAKEYIKGIVTENGIKS